MANPKSKRSAQLVVIGVAVFVIGAALVFLASQRSAHGRPAATSMVQSQNGTTAGGSLHVSPTVTVPGGKIALAIDMPAASGLDGWAKPGELVDVYALVRSGPNVGGHTPPYSKLVLPKVPVLDVKPGGSNGSSYLLAVTPSDAERLTFYARFESLWLALANPSDAVPVTRGADYSNAAVSAR